MTDTQSDVAVKLAVARSLIKIALQEMAAGVEAGDSEDGVTASTRRALEEAIRVIDGRDEELSE